MATDTVEKKSGKKATGKASPAKAKAKGPAAAKAAPAKAKSGPARVKAAAKAEPAPPAKADNLPAKVDNLPVKAGPATTPDVIPTRAAKGTAARIKARPATQAGVEVQERTAIKALGEGAVEAFAEIRQMIRNQDNQALGYWWWIGQRFIEVREKWEKEGFRTFCLFLALNHKEVILAMRMASLFTSDALMDLAARAQKHGGSVTWSHMRVLMNKKLTDRNYWFGLIEKTAISHEDLSIQIEVKRLDSGEIKSGKGGRRFNIADNVKDQRNSVHRQGKVFIRFSDQAGAQIEATFSAIPEEKYNAGLLQSIQAMREKFDEVARAATAQATRLVDIERKIELSLLAQVQAQAQAQAAGGAPDGAAPAIASQDGAPKPTVRKPPSLAKKA